MGITKTAQYTEAQLKISSLLKALGHPARIAILEYLLKVNQCICGDLVTEIQLAQPTISQHLKELKSANLIQGNIEGTSVCYCINQNELKNIQNFFNHISILFKEKNTNCC